MVPISFPKQKFHHLSPEQLIIIIAVMDCLICFSLNIFANFSYANFIHMPWSFQENFAEGLFLSLRFLVLMYFLGGYAPNRLSDPAFQSKVVSQAWLATFFLLVSVAFIAKTSDRLSRGVTIVLFGSGLIAMLSFHYIFSQYLRKYFNTGRFNIHRAILLCFGTKSKNITEYSGNYSGVCIVEKFHNPSSNCAEDIKKDLISFFTEFRHQITPFNVDFIILDMDWKFCAALEDLRQNYLPLPVPVLLWPDEEVIDIVSKPKMVFGHGQFLEIARAPLKRSEILSKRIFDIIIACIAILVLSPVMIIAAVAIVIDSGFPIVFSQKRRGLGGVPFNILKFRSMRVMENGDNIRQATRNDDRVTRVGKILRRLSIDELPQLFNVLAGSMSIIGPRPHAISHDDSYGLIIENYSLRHNIKPGITGWAQANGWRGETAKTGDMEQRVRYDIWYINNWSLLTDAKIILMTLQQLFSSQNAF